MGANIFLISKNFITKEPPHEMNTQRSLKNTSSITCKRK